MKKCILAIIAITLLAGQSWAQNARAMSKAEIVANMQMNAPELYRSYQSGASTAGARWGIIIGGSAAFIYGCATADTKTTTSGDQTTVYLTGTGGAIAVAGFACVIAGIPVVIIGNTKKRNARNAYLAQYGGLSLEPAAPAISQPHLEVRPGSLAFVF